MIPGARAGVDKNSTEQPLSDAPIRRSNTRTKSKDDKGLEDWLGVRDGIRNYLITAA